MTRAMPRREFIALCGGAAAAACASITARPVDIIDGRVDLRLADHPELAHPDGAIAIQVPGRRAPLFVLRVSDAEYAVLSPICTHRGCTVEVAGDLLECPCHGSMYNRTGGVVRGPAERALTRYPATLQGDRLVIRMEAGRS
jgi:Rieske Fe-S protein